MGEWEEDARRAIEGAVKHFGRTTGFYWVKRPGEQWAVAKCAHIIGGGDLDDRLPPTNEYAEMWAFPGKPFEILSAADWEIGPRLSPPA